MGQGLFTKVAQVVAHEFGVGLDRGRVSAPRTPSKVPNTSPTAASSGSDLNGMAARDAARTLKARAGAGSSPPRHGGDADAVAFVDGEVRVGGAAAAVRRGRPRRAYFARVPLSATGLLRDAEDPLRPDDADRPPVLLLRLRRGGVRGRRRHADRRVPAARRRHPARRRRVAEPGDRPRPDRGRLSSRATGWLTMEELVVGRRRRARHALAVDLQDPDRAASGRRASQSTSSADPNREQTIHRSKAVGEPPFMLALSAFHAHPRCASPQSATAAVPRGSTRRRRPRRSCAPSARSTTARRCPGARPGDRGCGWRYAVRGALRRTRDRPAGDPGLGGHGPRARPRASPGRRWSSPPTPRSAPSAAGSSSTRRSASRARRSRRAPARRTSAFRWRRASGSAAAAWPRWRSRPSARTTATGSPPSTRRWPRASPLRWSMASPPRPGAGWWSRQRRSRAASAPLRWTRRRSRWRARSSRPPMPAARPRRSTAPRTSRSSCTCPAPPPSTCCCSATATSAARWRRSCARCRRGCAGSTRARRTSPPRPPATSRSSPPTCPRPSCAPPRPAPPSSSRRTATRSTSTSSPPRSPATTGATSG